MLGPAWPALESNDSIEAILGVDSNEQTRGSSDRIRQVGVQHD
jgi:hypothetical protein